MLKRTNTPAIYLLISLLVLLLTYSLTIGQDPILTDDSPQALINRVPNIVDSTKARLISKKIEISSCKECFPSDSYIADSVGSNGFHFSKTQPFMYYQNNLKKYPLLLSRKMSGLPFLFLKSLNSYFYAKLAKNIFNFLFLSLTLIFSFLFIQKKYNTKLAFVYSMLLTVSPQFLMSYSGYVSEQIIAPLFWIICYSFLLNTRRSYYFSIVAFFVGLVVKLNFLVALVPIILLTKRNDFKFNKYIAHLLVAFLYILVLLFMKDGSEELIFRQGQGYFKPISHVLILFQEILAMISQSLISLNDSLSVKEIASSYYENYSFQTISSINFLGSFYILLFLYSFSLKNHKSLAIGFIIWCFLCFIVGHKDVTYSLRFSETYTLLVLLLVLSASSVKSRKLVFRPFLLIFLITWSLAFYRFYSHLKTNGTNGNQRISLFQEVSKSLVELKVFDPIMYFDENEWGYLEFLSDERVTPIYAQGLETRMSLEEIFLFKKSGYVLINLTVVHSHDNKTDIFHKESQSSIKNAASQSNVKVKTVRHFYHRGKAIYQLVYFESDLIFNGLTESEEDKLRSIPNIYNFR